MALIVNACRSAYREENGTVKRIELINFMCHKHLMVEFEPKITFITGPNGSGKSAILTALQVAFGIRANTTGRATRYDQLIRKGSDSFAKIIVTLRNVGLMAYKREEYGDEVVIEKIIKPKSNTVRMCNSKGVMVTERKRDVLEMLKHFNIKIDNPLVFMEQTTMKQFIQGDEKVKYDVLMQAMNFKSLEKNFQTTESNLLTMNDTLRKYKDVELGKKKEERDRAEEEMQRTQHLKDRQNQIVELKKRVVWADVQYQENHITSIEKEVATIDESITKIQENIEGEEKKIAILSEEESKHKQIVDGIQNDVKLLVDESQAVDAELAEISEPKNRIESEIESKTRSKKSTEKGINGYKKILSKVLKEIENETQKSSKKSDVDEKSAQLVKYEESMKQQESDVNRLRDEIEEYMKEKNDCDGILTDLRNDQKKVMRKCEEVSVLIASYAKGNNEYTKFGINYPGFMNELKKQSRLFNDTVIGPIGSCIKVKQQYKQYAGAIESCITSFILHGFITNMNSKSDNAALRRLLNSHKMSFTSIYQLSYEGDLDIPSNQLPEKRFLTVLDAIEVSNPIVRKALVVYGKVEQKVLMANRSEAEKVCLQRDGGYRIPDHVNCIVLQNGDTIYVRNGVMSYSSVNSNKCTILEADTQAVLNGYKREENDLKRQCGEAKAATDAKQAEYDSITKQILLRTTSIKDYEARIRSNQKEMDRIRREIDALTREDEESELTSLRERQITLENDIRIGEENVKNTEFEIQQLNDDLSKQVALITPLQQRKEQLYRRINEAKDKASNARKGDSFIKEKSISQSIVEKCHSTIQTLEADRASKCEEIKKEKEIVTRVIMELGEENRVLEELNKAQCEKEVQRYTEDLNEEMQKMGVKDLQQLQQDYQRKRDAYEKSNQEYKSIEREGKEMEKLDKRQRISYSELKNEAQQQICKRFTKFLSQRKAEGKVEIDHQTKEVSLSVKMDSLNEEVSSQVSNIRVLSGGEKSFVTLSLIMATSHIIESPFFIMDEFDVFMDEANRVVSLHTIIDNARQENRQFIFITPHNLETVVREINKDKEASDIHIFQLDDHQNTRRQ